MRFVKSSTILVVAGALLNVGTYQKVAAKTVPFLIAGSGDILEGISFIPEVVRPHNSFGFATSLGPHTGAGSFEVIGFLSATEATFKSGEPYKFTSLFNRSNVLACNYGTVAATPGATEPGLVTLYPVDAENGIFYAVFLAEFTPALDKCTGKFARLTDGNFLMLAVTEPFQIVGPEASPLEDDPDGKIDYSWFGAGTLTFGH